MKALGSGFRLYALAIRTPPQTRSLCPTTLTTSTRLLHEAAITLKPHKKSQRRKDGLNSDRPQPKKHKQALGLGVEGSSGWELWSLRVFGLSSGFVWFPVGAILKMIMFNPY